MQQLSRMVRFHKALGDVTRLRILALLCRGQLHGQAIAGKLGITPATVTFHMTKLRDAGIVNEKRVKNTIYFYLNQSATETDAFAVLQMFQELTKKGDYKAMGDYSSIVKNFFTADGQLKNIPSQLKKRLMVFERLLQGLEMGKKYTEREINEHILKYHEDFATIRREFIIHQYMFRDNGIYELNPPEMWPSPDSL